MIAIDMLLSQSRSLGLPIAVHMPDGSVKQSAGKPEFELFIRNEAGMRALQSLGELEISEAYIRGNLDMEGDVVRALSLMRDALSDSNLWLKTWRRLQPLLMGREKLNPEWIAKHYDSGNIQFYAQDRDWYTYTPGIYEHDDDSMEDGAQRKLQFAFDSLRLKEGHSLLEVGCGWGGFTRYCAKRGVSVTGITLSKDQLKFTQEKIREEQLDATALYQDFFTYEPSVRFDGISMMGVIEDLSDYPRVIERLAGWIKPGGRIYLDFGAATEPFGTSSFITKYVWPGTFRMVYMPELVTAVTRSPFEIAAVYNDRRNYHLWAKKGHARWVEQKDTIVTESSIETWRLMNILFAGTSAVMNSPSHSVTAFRMVLEYPADAVPRRAPACSSMSLDAITSQVKMKLGSLRQ